MNHFSDSSTLPHDETITCRLTQQYTRPQMIGRQNASAASPLSETLPVDGHMIGISRSKKPEQMDSREWAGSQFYGQASTFAGADRPREHNLEAERRRLRSNQPQSTFENVQSALQVDPSTTSSTKAMSISGQVQRPDRTRDSTILSLPSAGPPQPSSRVSFVQSMSSREALYCESTTSSRGESAGVSQSESSSSCEVVGGPDYRTDNIFGPRTIRRIIRSQYSLPSFSRVISTRGALTHPSATGMVYPPRSTRVSSAQSVGVADHSLSKPGHHSLFKPGHHSLPVVRRSGESPGTSMGWRASSGSKLAEQQVQRCLGLLYFFALLRATQQGKKMSRMSLGAVLAAALVFLSLCESALR